MLQYFVLYILPIKFVEKVHLYQFWNREIVSFLHSTISSSIAILYHSLTLMLISLIYAVKISIWHVTASHISA